MSAIKKHQWDYGTFDDNIVSVKATITEERQICKVDMEKESIRFNYEWISVKELRTILNDYDNAKECKVREDAYESEYDSKKG